MSESAFDQLAKPDIFLLLMIFIVSLFGYHRHLRLQRIKHQCQISYEKIEQLEQKIGALATLCVSITPQLDYVQNFNTIYKTNDYEPGISTRIESYIDNFEHIIFSIGSRLFANGQNNGKLETFRAFFTEKYTQEQTLYFFEKILPTIVQNALQYEKVFPNGVPELMAGDTLNFNKNEVACLLSLCFLCAYPERDRHTEDYSIFSFFRLFSEDAANFKFVKLRMLMAYFESLLDQSNSSNHEITCSREQVEDVCINPLKCINKPMAPVRLVYDKEVEFEHMMDHCLISSANKYIGGAPGGVLATGKMQEPIDFAAHPEMLILLLITKKMNYNEAVSITGVAQYTKHKNYGLNLRFDGTTTDKIRSKTRNQTWINIDSVDFRKFNDIPNYQFLSNTHIRQLTKLYAGMKLCTKFNKKPVVSGIWGGDAFGGCPELIFLQIWMAYSIANKTKNKSPPLLFCPYAYPAKPSQNPLSISQNLPTTTQLHEVLETFLNPNNSPKEHTLYKLLNNEFK